MLVLRVMALHHQGETQGARTALARALALATPMGYVSIFLEDGAPMAALLQQVSASSSVTSYVDKLLVAFPNENRETRWQGDQARAVPIPGVTVPLPYRATTPLVEPLTAREVEVLRLVADGVSNGEIAQRLIVSLGTVKKHTANIFGKLEVQSRTQAVRRARELNLL